MSGGQSAEWTETDRRFMAAAIRLSLWNRGLTGENPSVGALIVRQGAGDPVIVGRGVTAFGGRPHAELVALREAGEAARGATAYVTLEPCSHIGKAPPCADALVSCGVSRVVIAALDPDKRVAGRGVSILRQAGIEVASGCLEDEARHAMAGFLSLKGRGRPWLTLKMAVSADGMIGRSGAGQVPITGETARRAVQMMRVEHEAIMVGVGTAVADDPLLNVRLPGLETRSPTRVIIDPFLRTPPASRLFDDAAPPRVLMLASAKADRRRLDALKERGADIRTIGSDYKGRFDPVEILRVLGVIGLKSVLLEGGAETARRFLDAGLVDRIALFTGDAQVGTDGIASPINENSIPPGFEAVRTASYGKDRLIEYERTS
ncbi:bifunctional diaminohydroxyphosphoribosylaminopyrimidine deaminase/5-amino-6-(5-phosphoribosylamino)uracil reductase RibD [Pseudaminobacter sp. 19-2017]|uniref:Riboflavin biosynthesis protein RibD n=1 Tax=Pseudaminobacter soli (ex Zhang et al. 2022) TaxID=2831468 RepID=A0A942DYA8_9HYPH|nr:bifunctional diaminohydroxyphosphoribosylaminopyrimidine deaminase/5-amino-6-(5-phosphoribosylamino)uracil reductase RibD [Pseudaminobacter soli]MBS3649618.1 bifunctional diaminohydroxyphosphoribosylaminopyrimidine deaminase/5-amino-6-(5-phosphoribosylamino)uracil reductase RibD [Pseudaminobacter soli]